MGKASGVSRRRKKKYNYNVNKKKLHKKMITMPNIKCKQIKAAWNPKKSYLKNMEDMGLSADPNKTIKFSAPMEIDVEVKKKKKRAKPIRMDVASELEAEANAPRPKSLRLPTDAIKFSVYMIEKYGEDYSAMAKDSKNYYQETPKQIRGRINKFKNIPQQWNGYLRAKRLLIAKSKVDEYTIDVDEIMQN